MKKIAIFSSGNGSNAENIIRFFSSRNDAKIAALFSNKADAYVHQRVRKWNIPSYTFTRKDFSEGSTIITQLQNNKIDFIVLAGFLCKISPLLIQEYPHAIINIHPALLPKFGGKGMYGSFVHEAVITAGEAESGITIHYINNKYDDGDIIFQRVCPVYPNDTPDLLAERVHELEYKYFPKIIASCLKQLN